MRIFKPKFAALFLSLVTLFSLSITALASTPAFDPDAECAIQIKYLDEGKPIVGVKFSAYRVADINSEGEFTWTAAYKGYNVDMDMDNTSKFSQTLAIYTARDSLPASASAVTGADGMTELTGLKPGMYLITGESSSDGKNTLYPVPAIVFFPYTGSDGHWAYGASVEIKHEVSTEEKASVKALKVWRDDGSMNRPTSITVQLIRDGSVFDEQVLSAANDWRYIWTDLDEGHQWAVVEKYVPDGYRASMSQEGITFVITNRAQGATPSIPSEPPKDTPPEDTPPEDASPEDTLPETTPPENTPTEPTSQVTTPPTVSIEDEFPPKSNTESGEDPDIGTENPVVPETPAEDTPSPSQHEDETPSPTVNIDDSKVPLSDTKLPQTGLDWTPVIGFACLGILCVVLGLVLRRKGRVS